MADRAPTALSGGQRQRVALARALVDQPAVLLLDEPLGALDLKLREQMQIELARIQRDSGITFVLVTHDQDEALTLADRVVVFNDGRVEQAGPPHEVYERPASAFVAGFVGTSNIVDGVSVRPEKITHRRRRARAASRARSTSSSTPAPPPAASSRSTTAPRSPCCSSTGRAPRPVPARGERVRLTWHPEHEIRLKEAP